MKTIAAIFASIILLVSGARCQRVHGVPTFEDTFTGTSINSRKWNVSNYTVNNYAGGGSDVTFSPINVKVDNGLKMTLSQPTAFTSSGAELTTVEKFGYGTYEFVMRAGSTSSTPTGIGETESGQISSTFIIYDPPPSYLSITEIDAPEIEGVPSRSNEIEWTVWLDGSPTSPPPTILTNPADGFHTYAFTWSENMVQFYVDGRETQKVTSGVPSAPAVIDLNFYGTNNLEWGGVATVGVTRYMYIKSVAFWAERKLN